MTKAYVISDLHLGAGPGNPLEDFTEEDDAVFDGWVRSIAEPGTTLFLNGDFIDFAQIDPVVDPDIPRRLLWTQADSQAKFAIAVAGHRRCFEALEALLDAGGTIHVLVGNHDFDLDWPLVQDDFRAAVGGGKDDVAFTTGSYLHDGVHIEHGYQFTPENCPANPTCFRHEHQGTEYLERVWGTDFLLSYFNQVEASAPYADNVKPMLRLVYHGFTKRWIPRRHLLSIITFLRQRGIPWGALASVMAEEGDPIDGVYSAFTDDAWRELVADTLEDPEELAALQAAIAELDAVDRGLLARETAVDVRGANGASSDGGSMVMEPLPGDPGWDAAAAGADARVMGFLGPSREAEAAAERLSHPGVTHVVFGHTHRVVDGGLDGRHFNPGTWNSHLHLSDTEVVDRIRREGGITESMLRDPSLYRTDRRAVLIEGSEDGAAVRVRLVEVP